MLSAARLRAGLERPDERADGRGVELPFARLDALVQGGHGVTGHNRHLLLGEDRPGVGVDGGHMHRAPRDRDAGCQCLLDGVPPREGRQQGGVGVEDPPREGVEERAVRTVPKPAMATRSTSCRWSSAVTAAREARPVEAGAEAPEGAAVDELGVDTGVAGDVESTTRSVGEHECHRHTVGEHGLEDASGPRHEHGHAHAGHATSAPASPDQARRPTQRASSAQVLHDLHHALAGFGGVLRHGGPGVGEGVHLGLGRAL